MYSAKGMKILVLVFSLFSRSFSRIKNLAYDYRIFKPRRAPLPVISVGSIALGGTEKTPLAMEVLRFLLDKGHRPALVFRGYKGRWEKEGGLVSDGAKILATWEQAGDEPFMVARAVPGAGILVGKNRFVSCERAAKLGFDVAVLDDGFQHRRLARNLDIAVYSPLERIALREPRSSLRRTDIILVNAAIPDAKIARELPRTRENVFTYAVEPQGFFHLWDNESIAKEELGKMRLLAFCGIAGPDRFFAQLQTAGARVVSSLIFPDHHPYPDSSVEKILRTVKTTGAGAAVTTEKDAAKLLDRRDLFSDLPVYWLKIGVRLEPGFYARLESFLRKTTGSHFL
ncbi:MAG: tetraacyldisaccharide 4'-kinase [Candidatus Aminicenantes bacterium]|nr:tetraacyldisaccharide 4'-kinase [Candidatus Aminicenantes bacterium]